MPVCVVHASVSSCNLSSSLPLICWPRTHTQHSRAFLFLWSMHCICCCDVLQDLRCKHGLDGETRQAVCCRQMTSSKPAQYLPSTRMRASMGTSLESIPRLVSLSMYAQILVPHHACFAGPYFGHIIFSFVLYCHHCLCMIILPAHTQLHLWMPVLDFESTPLLSMAWPSISHPGSAWQCLCKVVFDT